MRLQLTGPPAATVLAAFALVGVPAHAWGDDPWTVGTDVMVYSDDDAVQVVTPQTSVRYRLDDQGGEVSARAAVDVVSAASVDVVAQASLGGFHETREEVQLGASKAFREALPSVSYRLSYEPDYVSNGVHLGWQQRLGTPDSVLSLGYGFRYDIVGQRGTPFANWSRHLTANDADLSFTQVLDTRTVVRAVYTLSVEHGYLEKPYRYVPLFDAATWAMLQANGVQLDLANFGQYRLPGRVPEQVPDTRVGNALGLRALRYVDPLHGSLGLDYELYLDSFGVLANIVEPSLYVQLRPQWRLRTFARLYAQHQASFYQRQYVVPNASVIPRWRTLDRKLSTYRTLSGGLRVEWAKKPFGAYLQGSVIRTWYQNYLFLDGRLALVALVGLRWTP